MCDKRGWVPSWLVNKGCTWCYDPAPIQPAAIIPASIPAPIQPAAIIPMLDEQFRSIALDPSVWRALCHKAAVYFDSFDTPGSPEVDKTSYLLARMTFATPSWKGPLPLPDGDFQHIDSAEWCCYESSTSMDMIQAGVTMNDYWTQSTNMSELRLFHGTVWGAVVGMLASGGFIPGPGRCRKNSRSVKGCFCADSFDGAFAKGMGHQLDYATDVATGDKSLNLFCMPVVVELRAVNLSNLRLTHMHGSKYCFEPPLGWTGVLPGVIIQKIYINKILVANFAKHHLIDPTSLQDPEKVRVCGQSRLQFKVPLYQATCGKILDAAADYESIKVSKGGIWYCKACSRFIREGSHKIVYSCDNC